MRPDLLADEHRLRRFSIQRDGVFALDGFEVLDEYNSGRSVLVEPAVSRMAHDGQDPGSSIAMGEIPDAPERTQASILHHILGVGATAGEPARQSIGIVQMGQHHTLETRSGVA